MRILECSGLKSDNPSQLMKKIISTFALMVAAVSIAQANTISNNWSGVLGDRGNMTAFAFKADAGAFPTSIDPFGSLTPSILLTNMTLFRPNDATTPVFGTGTRQLTSSTTPVFLDVYTTKSGTTFSGYLGSSSSSVTWASTVQDGLYSFDFSSLSLASNLKYWFVFSEDNVAGDDANFRVKLNTSGSDAVAGQGRGYLTGDLQQSLTQAGADQDWGFAFTAGYTAVPEPTVAAVAGMGLVVLTILVRRRR
jgi:hypothetical protein